MKKAFKLIICVCLVCVVSSCDTLQNTVGSLYDGTTITYNAKKNTFSAKTKVNKHLIIKY